jgi:hypothetical protein
MVVLTHRAKASASGRGESDNARCIKRMGKESHIMHVVIKEWKKKVS